MEIEFVLLRVDVIVENGTSPHPSTPAKRWADAFLNVCVASSSSSLT